MVIDGGNYVSNGVGSPAIYSTADIAVSNASLTANGSEAVCIEGLNSIHLYDCDLTGNMSDLDQNDNTWTVILYQSMSGDSEVGNSTFQMDGGSLTGAVVDDESYAGEGGEGYCNVYVSADSTWTVTGDSTVSSLENEGTIVDSNGKTVTIQGTDGTVYVQGDSEYTITTGSYSDTADMSGATAIQDQSVYTVEKPDPL